MDHVGALGVALAVTTVGFYAREQRTKAVASTQPARVAQVAAVQEKGAEANAAQTDEALKTGDVVSAELLAPAAFDTNLPDKSGRDTAIIDGVFTQIAFRTTWTLTGGTGLSVAAAQQQDAVRLRASRQPGWWVPADDGHCPYCKLKTSGRGRRIG